ncbi:hypothetical protein NMY22_g497 [Coprinellus aureogranulatus]|nr:hypothetical protein NMY22_g497 [Coprinellus aureogranulatus]
MSYSPDTTPPEFSQCVTAYEPEEDMMAANMAYENLGLGDGFSFYLRELGTLEELTQPNFDSQVVQADQGYSLHPHQIIGVHSILDKIFYTADAAFKHTSVLLADERGTGKTLQYLVVIGLLMDAVRRQRDGLELPPFLRAKPLLGNLDRVPSLPTLILVPECLLSQCQRHVQLAMKGGTVDTLVYPGDYNKRRLFWQEDGPFQLSAHPPHARIIVSTHEALESDFGCLKHTTPSYRSGMGPTTDRAALTLFGQCYLTVVLDECHRLPHSGDGHIAARLIMERCTVAIPCTSMPFETFSDVPKTIAAIGRLTNIPYFSSQENLDRIAKDRLILWVAKAQGSIESNLGVHSPLSLRLTDTITRMRERFDSRLVSRSWDSIRPKTRGGLNVVEGFLRLSDCEYKCLESFNAEYLPDLGKTTNQNGTLFYSGYGHVLLCAPWSKGKPRPSFTSLDEFRRTSMTKIDTWQRKIPESLTRKDKIIVYVHAQYLLPLLANVLDLHGVRSLYLQRSMPPDTLDRKMREFWEPGPYRVLLLSSYLENGMDLTCANNIIFLDQPWSPYATERLYRLIDRIGQRRKPTAYHLLALDTVDMDVYISRKRNLSSSELCL